MASASAVVVVTPVYKSSYSGLLKAFLDLLPQDGLKGKPVLAIATAGSSAHALTLDFALQPVLSALRARYVLSSVHALDYQVSWTAEAGLQLDADLACRIEEGVRHLVNGTRPHGLLPSSYPPADAFFPASAVDPELARSWDCSSPSDPPEDRGRTRVRACAAACQMPSRRAGTIHGAVLC